MQCDACGQALESLIALGDGVRAAFRAGAVSSSDRRRVLAAAGRAKGCSVREYRLPHNGSVNCTVAPDDELLVARLETPLQGVERLDALVQHSLEPVVQHRLQDVPFDPQAGRCSASRKLDEVRRLPAHTVQVTLLSVESGGTHELGRYVFRHRPWPGW